MVVRIRAIDHVVLRVADLDQAIRFYTEILSCAEEHRIESIGLVQMRAGASMIDLLDASKNPPRDGARNLDHFAVQIEEFDEFELLAYLEAHGVKHGDVQIVNGAEGVGPAVYIEDPDGNTVELKGPVTRQPTAADVPAGAPHSA